MRMEAEYLLMSFNDGAVFMCDKVDEVVREYADDKDILIRFLGVLTESIRRSCGEKNNLEVAR